MCVQALLTDNHVYSCGAIVLSDQWVVTAAHCVWRKPAAIFHVTVGEPRKRRARLLTNWRGDDGGSYLMSLTGEHDRKEDEKTEQKRRVIEVRIHPDYNQSSSDSDLALLKLYRPVKLGRHVVPICLPAINSTFTRTLATIRHSTVSGWGRLAQFGPPARVLQRLELPRVPLQECRLHTQLNITSNMLCAGLKAGGRDACEGDSGGPLVTRYKKTWFLTGVVSWGKGCANENMYGIYTKVSNFLGWMETTMSTG